MTPHLVQGRAAWTAWLTVVLWLAITLAGIFAPHWLPPSIARYCAVLALCAFAWVHGVRRHGATGMLVYFAIAMVVANLCENLSIATGFPFGHYHHTAAMGPKLWQVPLVIGPIFAAAGYLGWAMAALVLGDVDGTRRVSVGQPLIAAFITTSWDLCVDPIGGTLNRDWIWAEGGGYFGVPWLNFFGWMLTMWVIFQLFAMFAARHARPAEVGACADAPALIALWTLLALQFPLLYVLLPDAALVDPAGAAWRVSDLLESMAVVSVFTMLYTSTLAWYRLRETRAA